ncbi:GntR family transcriptional regulator YhfZ [Vibrio sp. LaRot3]|uniref:GntR family transcriptional regulator YhfZ n=1 Tax=Vibrio sp. LaRot3 TaxID=2998829 RepID=UPI0022CDED1B|nr:GntR family transcriptional regulator YhfZ [Vibrio sp. LaRot3]MDA0149799.1 GntR family transcriptional regulator YhfZ [Vibrio sp. LaRot3]
MPVQYISKEGAAIMNVAQYLITTSEGDRLRTIDSLSEEFAVSVGFIQKALTTIEQSGAVILSKQGRNGTFISQLNYRELVKCAGLVNVVCAMPLPYTRHYEGLASGLKAQIGDLPLYFAHMRGASVRAECLRNGTYDIAIMSKLAAKELASGLVTAIDLGPRSYSHEHRLIYKQGRFDDIKRVGVDPDSPDQKILTTQAFQDKEVEIVEIHYGESLTHLANGDIDAVVWLPEAIEMEKYQLAEKSLSHLPACRDASEAVMLVNGQSNHITILLRKLLNQTELLGHQKAVVNGEQTPSY